MTSATAAAPVMCADCGAECVSRVDPATGSGAPGYAECREDGRRICYGCATRLQLQDAYRTGHLFAYLTLTDSGLLGQPPYSYQFGRLTSWAGVTITERVSVGAPYKLPAFWYPSTRRNVRAILPDGSHWYGVYYESSGDYVRMRRTMREKQMSDRDWLRWRQ